MRVVVVPFIFMLVHKQALVGTGLDHQKNPVHGGGNQRHQHRLPCGEIRVGQRHWKHQNNHRQRKQGDKILFNAEQVHMLGGEFPSAQQQREAHQPASDDHNDGIEGIAHQGGCRIAGGHQRGDQTDFKDHNGETED